MTRPTLDEAMMQVAEVMAQRATLPRLKVGAVLAKDGHILSTGYNGAPAGLRHCSHAHGTQCPEAVHAEANALIFAGVFGAATDGAHMFITHAPCIGCSGLVVNAGIKRVVYARAYRHELSIERLRSAGLAVEQLRRPGHSW